MKNRIIILMGVSGSGKTTIGKMLSEQLDTPFFDSDDFHSSSNVEKMRNGIPLNDADRTPWLSSLSNHLANWKKTSGAILACSALKKKYRSQLSENVDEIDWVFLDGTFDLIQKRMLDRSGHYMKPGMLQSQFDALEIPEHGMRIDIDKSPEKIVQQITEKLNQMEHSEFGVIGLGVMGRSISLNLAEKQVQLSVYNRTEGEEHKLISEFQAMKTDQMEVREFDELEPFVRSIERPRKILIMIKAGNAIDHVIKSLVPFLEEGDVLIDGGNSHYTDTIQRMEGLKSLKIGFIGCGISGGEEGARFGPSIMPGGKKEDYQKVATYLEKIAAKDKESNPCCTYIGPEGAGHFVKMVHNGIEYAEMQLLAEMYHLLAGQFTQEEIADIFTDWNKSDLSSYLLEITINILRKKEGDSYILDLILDEAGNKGTGNWSTKAALDLGVANSMMAAAVFARYQSSDKESRMYLSENIHHFEELNVKINPEALEFAYRFARIINHHQGFILLYVASLTYKWDLSLSEISRIWTNGCIIRSALMEDCVAWLQNVDSLKDVPGVIEKLVFIAPVYPEVLKIGMKNRVPMPVFTAAWNDWISSTSEKLPANLIQAQRDYFGAHTYKREDDLEGKSFHTKWK